MNTDRLQDALRRAVERQPRVDGRADAALRLAVRRRNTRLVATSCAAAVTAVVASLALSGGSGQARLRPVVPVESPTETPSGDPSATPYAADPTATATPSPTRADESAAPRPSSGETPRDVPPPDVVASYPPPTPLDVFVLLDGTVSMQSSYGAVGEALRQLDGRLREDRVDVAWGLGLFRDSSLVDRAHPSDPTAPAYERVRPVTPGWSPAFGGLQARGGDSDQREGTTFGLDGLLGVGHEPYSASGEDAGFRAGARRVVLLVTDAGTMTGSEYPTVEDSLARLNAANVSVFGLQVLDINNASWAHDDMAKIVAGTGVLAPRAIDVNEDGRDDIKRGAPVMWPINTKDEPAVSGLGDVLAWWSSPRR